MKCISRGLVALMLFMAGCAGHHAVQQEAAHNPYVEKAEQLNKNGVAALQKSHPAKAGRLFAAARQAATLADDASWIALSGYNMGRAYAAEGDNAAAETAYQKAMQAATAAGDGINLMRIRLALALLGSDVGDKLAVQFVADDFPIDVHLAAGQLAVMQDRQDIAQHAYARVLALAGEDRAGLLYSARAHLGLADLARASDDVQMARAEGRLALALLHRAGAPELTAQALRFIAGLEKDLPRRRALLQRSENISHLLKADRKE
ncbi:MAG: hypothetical protein R8K53_03300 [Mariprofundaceae bacterium]